MYKFDNYYYFKGRILNRFSKDIGFMDDILIKNFSRFFMVRTIMVVCVLIYNNFQNSVKCLSLFVTAVVANYYLLPGFILLCGLYLGIMWYYIRTARDIKRLEALGVLPIKLQCFIIAIYYLSTQSDLLSALTDSTRIINHQVLLNAVSND